EFGPNIVGIQAASRHFFDADLAALSLSQVAALVAIPRGPSLYAPRTHLPRVLRRRDRILRRLEKSGKLPSAQLSRALHSPLQLHAQQLWPGAHHWVRRLARSAIDAGQSHIRSTLDYGLQRDAENLVAAHAAALVRVGGDGAAAIIIDNATREVL